MGGRTYRGIFSVLIVLTFALQPSIGLATADGGIFAKSHTVFQVDEESQYAVIHHLNGVQRMLISVSFDWQESDSMAWILPIPSTPHLIGVEIIDGLPEFSGSDLIEDAKDAVVEAAGLFTIAYPVSLGMPWPLAYVLLGMPAGLIGGTSGYSIHEHLEMGGLIVEVVSATEGMGIYSYLIDNGLAISKGIIPQLDAYVDDDFSFVVTWIEETGTTLREPGIIVRFPTERMFYPLALTSVYGSRVVPLKLLVTGYVSPRIYDGIRSHTEVTYYRLGSVHVFDEDYSDGLRSFVTSIRHDWNKEFTVIELSAPSSALTEDLWIDGREPEHVTRAAYVHELMEEHGIIVFLLLFAFFSPMIGLVVGMAVLGPNRDLVPYYFVYGLSNIIGIVGLIIGAETMKRRFGFQQQKLGAFILVFFFAFYGTFMAAMGVLYLLVL